MNDELKKYDIIDTFDENRYQTVLMGIDNSNYDDIVIINKLYKSEHINNDFMEHYKKIADNILSVYEADKEITVISQYEQASLLSDFITESSLDLDERIRLGKSFLYQLSDFSSFNLGMQMVFIQSDQLTIKNGVLKFSNYIFLKEFQTETTQIDLFREIGKTLELILQLHREKLTSELSALQQFIYQLLNSNDMNDSYNDLYNRFKVVAATIREDEILYSPTIDAPQNTDAIIEAFKQIRIPKEVIASSIEEIEPNSEEELINEEESNEILQLLQELEEDIILVEDDVKIIEENVETVETISYDFEEIEETDDEILIESLEEAIEDVSVPSEENLDNAFDQLSKFGDEDLEDLLNTTDFEVKDIYQEETIETEIIAPNLDELIQASLEDVLTTSEDVSDKEFDHSSKLNVEDLDDLSNTNDFEMKNDSIKETINSEIESDDLEELIQTSSNDEDEIKLDEPHFEDIKITEAVHDDVSIENQTKFHDEKHHSIHLNNDSDDPIQEILDRNDKQYSDLYVTDTKSKKKFLPTFLFFFIILIIITSLLIFYSSTYM